MRKPVLNRHRYTTETVGLFERHRFQYHVPRVQGMQLQFSDFAKKQQQQQKIEMLDADELLSNR